MYLEGAAKQGKHPLVQEDAARDVLIPQISIHQGGILTQQLPEDLVGLFNLWHVEVIKVKHYIHIQNVTESLKALLRGPAVQQEHASHVAHALDVTDVRPEVLKR